MYMPRIVISGTAGGAGKTTTSLGLVRALVTQGVSVHPFKKGPDYIDTAWLGRAAKGIASTLDPFFFDSSALRAHFAARCRGAGMAVIEGNRGFFDGRDINGSCSTEVVAAALDAPVVLVVDITKMMRSTAAVVAGFRAFPGGERIAGVILNRCGGLRHAAIARRAVEELAGVPVYGVLPRVAEPFIPERRAGLITVDMHDAAEEALDSTAAFFCRHVDVPALRRLAESAPNMAGLAPVAAPASSLVPGVRIGVVRDGAFWQYYDENLQALRDAGAKLVFLSLLTADSWPDIDGLYIGGGDIAPYAEALAANTTAKERVCGLVRKGMPVYAEQAGYWFLGESLEVRGVAYPMAGILPVSVRVTPTPGKLGYMEATVIAETPYHLMGTRIRGHAYYYGDVAVGKGTAPSLREEGGAPFPGGKDDGIAHGALFASCMQIFAPAVPGWASSFVRAASAWRRAAV